MEYGAPIFFVERGNCTFVKKASGASKAGKMLIIADNSDQEDVDKIVMGDDLSGTQKRTIILKVLRKLLMRRGMFSF